MRIPLRLSVVSLTLLSLTSIAFSQPAVDVIPMVPPIIVTTPGEEVGSLILKLAMALLVPLLGAVCLYTIKWIKRKTNLDLTKQIMAGADLATGFAEQTAKKYANNVGVKLVSNDKMKIAAPWLTQLAIDQKWPEWAKAKIEELIEARLGQKDKEVIIEPVIVNK